MSFTFRKAVREDTNVLVGIAGGTGSGKSMSALRVARGLAGPNGRIGFGDTEAGRALHYVGVVPKGGARIEFEHATLSAPFTPARYLEMIVAAEKEKFDVFVIDSASHEHAGDGGLLDMHEAELQRMAKEDPEKRDRVKMAAWIKPKGEHKKLVTKLLQMRCHLIFCFRAEPKVEMRKVDGRMQVVEKVSPTGLHGWMPIAEKNLPYEMTCSFLVTADKPGVPQPIKLQEQHRDFFPLDKPLSELSGELLAKWAAGGEKKKVEPAGKTESVRCTVVSVTRESGKSQRTGQPWTVDEITISYRETATLTTAAPAVLKTRNTELGDRAKAFAGTGEIVDVEYRETDKGWELLEIYAADQPA